MLQEHDGGGSHVGVEHPPRAREHPPPSLEAVSRPRHGHILPHGGHIRHAHGHLPLWKFDCHLFVYGVSTVYVISHKTRLGFKFFMP